MGPVFGSFFWAHSSEKTATIRSWYSKFGLRVASAPCNEGRSNLLLAAMSCSCQLDAYESVFWAY